MRSAWLPQHDAASLDDATSLGYRSLTQALLADLVAAGMVERMRGRWRAGNRF